MTSILGPYVAEMIRKERQDREAFLRREMARRGLTVADLRDYTLEVGSPEFVNELDGDAYRVTMRQAMRLRHTPFLDAGAGI